MNVSHLYVHEFSTISLGNHNDEISFPLTKGFSLSVCYPQSYKFKTQTQDSLKNIALNIEYILYGSHEIIMHIKQLCEK